MRHTVSLTLVAVLIWILLSGHTEPFIVALGVLSVVIVVAVGHRMDVVDNEGHSIRLTWHVLTYWPWLIWQILKSNLDVAKVILGGGPVRPVVFQVRAAQRSEAMQVVFANSITLTPGTVTMGMENSILTVHALTAAGAGDLADAADGTPSEMNRRCAAVENRHDGPGAAA